MLTKGKNANKLVHGTINRLAKEIEIVQITDMRWFVVGLIGLLPAVAPMAAPVKDPATDSPSFELAMLRYEGGSWKHAEGEMRQHVSIHVPNFLRWLNSNHIVNAGEQVRLLTLSDNRIFNYPLLFIDGHYRWDCKPREKENLKSFLERGGFLYIEDCGGTTAAFRQYGCFADQIHEMLTELFPKGEWRILPFDHEIYRFPFRFPNGLPNICGAENDARPDSPLKLRKRKGGEGFYSRDRMVAFYSDADNCCAWGYLGGAGVTWGDSPFKMGANVITYAMTH